MIKFVDFVILLPGNSYVMFTSPEQAELMGSSLNEACTPNADGATKCWINLQDGNRKAQIKVQAVLGWYTKPHTDNLQERVLRKVDKTLDEQNKGEAWKEGGDGNDCEND